MTAITNFSQLINIKTGGSGATENLWSFIDSRSGAAAVATPVASRMISLWTYNKNPGGTGAAPGAAANPVNDTVGALYQTDPAMGTQKWLVGWGCLVSSSAGTMLLYDRLAHVSGLNATTTTAQTFTLTVSRYTGTASVGNGIGIEIYTQIGSTGTTITASYTNQAGTAGRTTKAIVFGGTGFREAQRFLMCPLQDGDTGVRSVESVTVLASTTTAGDFGVTIVRPILTNVVGATSIASIVDCVSTLPSMPEIMTDACLSLLFTPNVTTAPQVTNILSFASI